MVYLVTAVVNNRNLDLGLIAAFAAGFLDDMLHLTYKLKFFLGSVVAFIFVLQNDMTLFSFHGNLVYIITFFWFLAVTNGFNMVDGLNGLSTGIFIIYFLLTGNVTWIWTIFPVFLFNIYGKIFLGDSGTFFLSYMIIKFSTEISNDLLYLTIFFGYPSYEVASSFLRRIFSKKNPFLADRGHLHHVFTKKIGERLFLVMAYSLALFFGVLPHKFYSIIIYIGVCFFIYSFQRKFESGNSHFNL
ncbi:undecaprenyl/decaprenyl-phosphate alpha-N-acetylglucosaminyl 1-phosphate transferase [Thermosipho ferrireducens]|uniref:Undecaprenyl/decaprenyl-phosphate alpha-N-acetylglucosaminyl 1-phosphate transferase n=1 Tax=Thermosipho ferrireducens TaxID=2571116 RepID=A0ABX7S7Q1_9BACT|nr:MraY family glycosyltransferase [Thermosipho ferrireducens]QTA37140.1 undecaprenyl/decaprenyl-phosphate alpha-N-acetylglucosaminyl 1-phosphate transferase [Thermosipho ferrireducens]